MFDSKLVTLLKPHSAR